MEPVILFISLTSIICITIVRLKRISFEREKFQLGNSPNAPRGPLSLTENREIVELRQRIQNLETIVNLGDNGRGSTSHEAQLRQQIAELSHKLEMLGLR